MNRGLASAAVGVGAFVLLAGAVVGGYFAGHSSTPSRVVTVTVTAPPKVITRDAAALSSADACIADLYQMIEGWITVSGSSVGSYQGGTATVPSGWWYGSPCPPHG